MCGICGIVDINNLKKLDKSIIYNMINYLKHRGPESAGYYIDNSAFLGHSRLSIIDVEGGDQPLSNENETIWLVFNGEIYNYIELTKELKKLGHLFKTKSDSEVIIHAYEEWGLNCFNFLNGQWALAIWDSKNKKLILSRDRLGIRPLYYHISNNRLIFASEIKSIFATGLVKREFDFIGLNQIFTFWSPVAPTTTFKNIKQIKSGNYAIFSNNQLIEKPYWNINFNYNKQIYNANFKENVIRFKELLIDATKLRFTRSDVPVGAYLSGGIDSSVTAAIIHHYTDSPLETFSIRFSDTEFDEGTFQNEMVKRLNSKHNKIVISPTDIGTVFPKVIWHTERPILRTAPAPLFLLSKLVHDSNYKVVVTGEGSDEVLGGYDIYREHLVRRFILRNPSSNWRLKLIEKLYPWMERSPTNLPAIAKAFFGKDTNINEFGFSHKARWDTTSGIKKLLNPEVKKEIDSFDVISNLFNSYPKETSRWDALNEAQWLEYVTLLSGYILSSQGDRMMMANSVEGRFPFLDFRLVDFANNLPLTHKIMGLDEKHILKAAFNDLIPNSILNRPKQPYRAPDAASFFSNDYLKELEWVEELTSESYLNKMGIFNTKAVKMLFNKAKKVNGIKMSNVDNMRIVGILSTLLVYEMFIHKNIENKNKKPDNLKVEIDKR